MSFPNFARFNLITFDQKYGLCVWGLERERERKRDRARER